MAGMEGLGRLFNVVPTADGVFIDMSLCSGVTFFCVGADTYTVQEAQDAAGTGAQNLVAWDRWYTNAGAAGATPWVLATDDTPAAAAAIAANASVFVSAARLSDGFEYVRCSSAAAGLVVAVLHDLRVRRDPANLARPAV